MNLNIKEIKKMSTFILFHLKTLFFYSIDYKVELDSISFHYNTNLLKYTIDFYKLIYIN